MMSAGDINRWVVIHAALGGLSEFHSEVGQMLLDTCDSKLCVNFIVAGNKT